MKIIRNEMAIQRGKKARRISKLEEGYVENKSGYSPFANQELERPEKLTKAQPLQAKTDSQRKYINAIKSADLIFGVGPAGTGKSYIAASIACEMLLNKQIDTIIITRPAVEAGEKLGFLPGEAEDKYAPYIEPFRDILEERMGKGQVEYMIKAGKIKGSPFAYMRGKAQPLTSLVLTPNGFVEMGSLKNGDYVIGSDGKKTKVTGVFPQGKKEVFEITMSDGAKTKACGEHLWVTQSQYEKRHKRGFTVKNTFELKKSLRIGNNSKNHQIPLISSPVEYESCEPLPINPYLLGALLGDGCITGSASISFSTSDLEILEKVKLSLPASCDIKHSSNYDYRIIGGVGRIENELKTLLKQLGLMGTDSDTKFIPRQYLLSSFKNRLETLRGLMDTDGCCLTHRSGKSRQQFSSNSILLANDVKQLVMSLGGTASISRKTAKNFNVEIVMPLSINPFFLKRKADIFEKSGTTRLKRLIDSVESIGELECQCISVEAKDNLYVTDDFIITHNTFKNAVVILDEAQNATKNQMKLFLTRIGENCKIIVDGDITQSDIVNSGLDDAMKRLQFIPTVKVVEFGLHEVVRSGLASEIVLAYSQEIY